LAEWEKITPRELLVPVRHIREFFCDGKFRISYLTQKLCYLALHPQGVRGRLVPYEEARDSYRNKMNPASVRAFDRTLSIGTEPAIFKAYFDAFGAGLAIEVERAVVDIYQVGIANATTLETHPVEWAKEHLTTLLDACSPSIGHWIRSVCDKQNDLRPDEDIEEFIFWRHWCAPRLIYMQPSGNAEYDPSSVWTREDEPRTANLLEALVNRFIVGLKADLKKMVGALHIGYAQARIVPQSNQASTLTEGRQGVAEKSAQRKSKLGSKKQDLSRYLDSPDLTERLHQCLSVRLEYGMRKSDIARQLGINRKTVDEHIVAGQKKIQQAEANRIAQKNRAKLDPGSLRNR